MRNINRFRAEIDYNFSRAHRIVTTSILPIVEQYAKHSEAVWEGSKVGTLSQCSYLNILASNPAIHSSGNNSSKPVPMFPYQATKRLLRMNLPLTKTHKRLKLTIAS